MQAPLAGLLLAVPRRAVCYGYVGFGEFAMDSFGGGVQNPGSHSLARAERDGPKREILADIAVSGTQPYLLRALTRITAGNAIESLDDELARVLRALESETPETTQSTEARAAYLSHFASLKEHLVGELRGSASAHDNGGPVDVSHHLAREFASVFWSGMLTALRRSSAADGLVPTEAVVYAISGSGIASRARESFLQAAEDFGLDAKHLEACGAKILLGALRDERLRQMSAEPAFLDLPAGLRLDRRSLEPALEGIESRYLFLDRPISGFGAFSDEPTGPLTR
jgi:hypothetical protein